MKLFRKLLPFLAGPDVPSVEVPSTSIYFSRLMADLISDTKDLSYPIWRIESNVFHTHGPNPSTIVMRYCSPGLRDDLLSGRFGRLILFLDDNFWAMDRASGLDRSYRKRLAAYRDATLVPLLRKADPLVVSSDAIAQSAGAENVARVDPVLIRPTGGLRHFDTVDARLSVVFPATRSHLVDLEMIADELSQFLTQYPKAHLTTFLGPHAPKALRLPNTDHRRPLDWQSYEAVLEKERFHLSIAPAIDSLFNQSRSLTRILDNAYLGAVGLYTDSEPFQSVVDHQKSGILVPREAGAWFAALEEAYHDRSALVQVAAAGQSLAQDIGDTAKWRRFWLSLLQIG